MREGDFVLIKRDSPGQIIEGSGVVLEVFDMPNTFGRRMISAFVSGRRKTYGEGEFLFKILSRGSLKRPRL